MPPSRSQLMHHLSRVYTTSHRDMLPGNKLLVRATCCLYPGNIITIHLCHGRLVSLCIQQRLHGNKLATILRATCCRATCCPGVNAALQFTLCLSFAKPWIAHYCASPFDVILLTCRQHLWSYIRPYGAIQVCLLLLLLLLLLYRLIDRIIRHWSKWLSICHTAHFTCRTTVKSR